MSDNFKNIAPGYFRIALKNGLHVKLDVIENNQTLHTVVANMGDDRVLVPWEDIAVAMPAAA